MLKVSQAKGVRLQYVFLCDPAPLLWNMRTEGEPHQVMIGNGRNYVPVPNHSTEKSLLSSPLSSHTSFCEM